MNPILLSFFCGLAFTAGAGTMLAMVSFVWQVKDKHGRAEMSKELRDSWERTFRFQDKQIDVLLKICQAISKDNER